MHELSIAESLIDIVKEHCPAGAVVQTVIVEAGPMRGIDNEAMQFAWQCATPGTVCQNSRLEVRILPWQLVCSACGAKWAGEDVYVTCKCGQTPCPVGGNDLKLTGIDVLTAEELAQEESNARVSRSERAEAE
jgi:Zn finger protein HypA/HybF involved in hydrogenase expression